VVVVFFGDEGGPFQGHLGGALAQFLIDRADNKGEAGEVFQGKG